MSLDLRKLDQFEGMLLRDELKIKSVQYDEIKPKILLTIVGLDYQTPDEQVLDYLNSITEPSGDKIRRQVYKEAGLQGIHTGKRTILTHRIKCPELFGSYQRMAEQNVCVFYHGVEKSCGWWYLTEEKCEQKARIESCKSKHNGSKLNLADQINAMDSNRTAKINEDANNEEEDTENNGDGDEPVKTTEEELAEVDEVFIRASPQTSPVKGILLEQMTSPTSQEQSPTAIQIHNKQPKIDVEQERKRQTEGNTGASPPGNKNTNLAQ